MQTLGPNSARWRKSSYSTHVANCVEVAVASEVVAVRDTKDRAGAMLEFSATSWANFLRAFR